MSSATRALAASMRELARVPSLISRELAQWATVKLRQAIDERQSPEGEAHAPLAAQTIRRKGHDHPLIHSRWLYGSLRAEPLQGAGIAMRADPPYAYRHMVGNSRMPARPFLPRRLPNSWRKAIRAMFKAHVSATIRNS